MPKSSAPYVLTYIANANDESRVTLCHEVIGTEDEAKARYAELAVESSGEVLVFRSMPVPAEVDTKPRVEFGVAHKPLASADKPKRKRRTKAEMLEARANGEAKPKRNGAAIVTGDELQGALSK